MGELRMQMIILPSVIIAIAMISGCNPSSRESQISKPGNSSAAQSSDNELLSANRELFPLSGYYGVCAKRAKILRASIDEGMFGYPTNAEIVGGYGHLKIKVGKLGAWPGAVLEDIPPTSMPRRIQLVSWNKNKAVLVSNFGGAGDNVVSINFDQAEAGAEAEAVIFANTVVACHVSAVQMKSEVP